MKRPRLRLATRPTWEPRVNPAVAAFVGAVGPPAAAAASPFAQDVRASKGSPAYRAHMYHTKVPPQAIEHYISHYTEPGGLVLDPFCGSGMTGVAALRLGRRALLSDLSPLATFLAYNHCAPVDADELGRVLTDLLDTVRDRLEPLYRTRCPACGRPATVRHVVWSDEFHCPQCRKAYVLWDVAMDDQRKVRASYNCPSCGSAIRKRLEDRCGSRPVAASLNCENGCDVTEVPIGPRRGRGVPFPTRAGLWVPDDEIPTGLDEISRVRRSGVRTVADLFTPRNLSALAVLWDAASKVRPVRLRARALFAVTAIMVRASRLIKYIPSRRMAPGPILGTMYLPSLSVEVNVLELFRRRVAAHTRAAADLRPERGPEAVDDLCISTQSASDLSNVPDASVDYVFTDPPFGHNIMYSELNFLWESWLGWRTDARREAVVSRSQRKGVAEYGDLMAEAFAEIHRVLRPGRWMTLVFHNTQAEVWAAIQRGVEAAGFRIEAIQTLDKQHETFKQVTAEGAVGYDVVVNCRTHGAPAPPQAASADPVVLLGELLTAAPAGPCKERSARYLHAQLTGELMRQGRPVVLDYRDVLDLLRQHFVERDKSWYKCPTKKHTP